MIVFNGHNDTITRLHLPEQGKADSFFDLSQIGHLDLPRTRQGRLAGGFFAIFTPPPPNSPERDPLYGLTFTENGYSVSERSPIEQQYAQDFTDGASALSSQLYQLPK
jgi:membrane dipeptidase